VHPIRVGAIARQHDMTGTADPVTTRAGS